MYFFGRNIVVFYRVDAHFIVNDEMSVFKNGSVELFPVDFYASADICGMKRNENFYAESRYFLYHFKKFVRVGEKNQSVLYMNYIGFYFGYFFNDIVSETPFS